MTLDKKSCGIEGEVIPAKRNELGQFALGSKHLVRHGGTYTSEYFIWNNIIDRCENPKCKAFANYGGRGIHIHPEWRASFSAFLEYVGKRPSKQHTLDRYPNNDGGYVPGNVRWATWRQQRINRRGIRLIEHCGERLTVTEWAERKGIMPASLFARLYAGWPIDKAIETPVFSPWRGGSRRVCQ